MTTDADIESLRARVRELKALVASKVDTIARLYAERDSAEQRATDAEAQCAAMPAAIIGFIRSLGGTDKWLNDSICKALQDKLGAPIMQEESLQEMFAGAGRALAERLRAAETTIANAWKELEDEPDDASDVEELALSIKVGRDYTRLLHDKEIIAEREAHVATKIDYDDERAKHLDTIHDLTIERKASAATCAELDAARARCDWLKASGETYEEHTTALISRLTHERDEARDALKTHEEMDEARVAGHQIHERGESKYDIPWPHAGSEAHKADAWDTGWFLGAGNKARKSLDEARAAHEQAVSSNAIMAQQLADALAVLAKIKEENARLRYEVSDCGTHRAALARAEEENARLRLQVDGMRIRIESSEQTAIDQRRWADWERGEKESLQAALEGITGRDLATRVKLLEAVADAARYTYPVHFVHFDPQQIAKWQHDLIDALAALDEKGT